jgi:glycosyltransferase involved in cell wall biosynthesis
MREARAPKRVLAIVANVKQFRIPFYALLAAELERHGIVLRVAYSAPDPGEALKGDSVDLPAPVGLKCSRLYMLRGRLLLQAVPPRELARADLVIIVQANGYLLNYPLLAACQLRLKRVAFWGHGYNHQGSSASLRERFRRLLVNIPDWWFAYTGRTASYLRDAGVANAKISVINNAVDTRTFAAEVAGVTAAEIDAMRGRLDIPPDANVALYCGSLYPNKHVRFLLAAGARIRAQLPGFVLLVVGTGPEADIVAAEARRAPWLRYCGKQFGRDKAVLFRMAAAFLNPGLVGLAILDSFAAGLPFITTDIPVHSPEIAYLEPGVNGFSVAHDAAVFADTVTALLGDRQRLRELGAGALLTSKRYTVDNMVANVTQGIVSCLEATSRRPGVFGGTREL